MKISDEFIEHSIIVEEAMECLGEYSEDICYEDDMVFFVGITFKDFGERATEIIQIIKNLENNKYEEARMGLRIRDYYRSFNSEIYNHRNGIKILMAELIHISSINKPSQINKYIKNWEYYDSLNKFNNLHLPDQHFIFQQFKKVNSPEELDKFKVFFHQRMVDLVFKLAEIFIQRLSYTIEYLQDEEAFKEVCGEATLNLRNFRNEIEKLKRKP